MLLGSVVHHTPTAAPHNWLLRYMRVVLFVYTINSWSNVFVLLGEVKAAQQQHHVHGD